MLSNTDLSDIYKLFIDGMIIGGLLSAIPFMISYAINGVINLIKDNT